jgi:glycosyltransferase involved in cell wall biosynthesis
VANGSLGEFLGLLRGIDRDGVRLVVLENAGIGAAYNAGIEACSTKWVLLMDSDCIFLPGALAAMLRHETEVEFVKGRVVFQSDNWTTRLTARGRRYLEDPLFTGRVNAYSPPLMYRTELVCRMGGFHFDDRLKWREDREFELRRRAAGIRVRFEPDATIMHKRLLIAEDLASVWNYGLAQRAGEVLGILPKLRAGHEIRKVSRAWSRITRQGGFVVSAYAVGRYLVMWWARRFGRWSERRSAPSPATSTGRW